MNSKQSDRVRDARAAATRHDDGDAFLRDPSGKRGPSSATDADSFGVEFLESALAGEPIGMDAQDEVVEEESGGPFLELDPEQADSTATIPEAPAPSKPPPRLI